MKDIRLALLFCVGVAACGSSDAADGSSDSAATNARKFPAFKPDIGQLKMGTGPVLKNARLVTITWPDDQNASQIESFVDKIGASQFWKTVTSEYGVGPAQSDASLHVHLDPSDLPAQSTDSGATSLFDTDLVNFVVDHAKRASDTGWPASDDQTVYLVYVPASQSLTTASGSSRTDACDSYEGYHDEDTTNGHLLYAIIDQKCGDGSLGNTTDTASHEIAEAATDPWASDDSTTALNGFDDEHLAWSLFNQRQEEDGDACEFYDDANVNLGGDLPFRVQSLWSNQAALAGHNPCIPTDPFEATQSAYYNVTPLEMTDIPVVISRRGVKTTTIAPVSTKGYAISDTSVDFQVGFYADKDPGGAWTLTATAGPFWQKSTEHRLSISFNDGATSATGKNGDKAKVHIDFDPSRTAANKSSGILITLISEKSGMPKHYMPVLIGIPNPN